MSSLLVLEKNLRINTDFRDFLLPHLSYIIKNNLQDIQSFSTISPKEFTIPIDFDLQKYFANYYIEDNTLKFSVSPINSFLGIPNPNHRYWLRIYTKDPQEEITFYYSLYKNDYPELVSESISLFINITCYLQEIV